VTAGTFSDNSKEGRLQNVLVRTRRELVKCWVLSGVSEERKQPPVGKRREERTSRAGGGRAHNVEVVPNVDSRGSRGVGRRRLCRSCRKGGGGGGGGGGGLWHGSAAVVYRAAELQCRAAPAGRGAPPLHSQGHERGFRQLNVFARVEAAAPLDVHLGWPSKLQQDSKEMVYGRTETPQTFACPVIAVATTIGLSPLSAVFPGRCARKSTPPAPA
jgi:hypothetical protein